MKNTILLIVFGLISVLGISQTTTETPLTFAQEMPTYLGGQDEMFQVIFDNVVYPEYEKSMNIEGSVYVKFIVEKDGTPTHFEVTRGVLDGPGLDSAALFACRQLGKFIPGKQNGVAQRVYITLPIKFTLADDGDTGLTKKEMKEIEKDGKYICDIMYKLIEAKRAGDQVKIEKLITELNVKLEALHKNYSDESARVKELDKIVEPCMEEATKAAMGK
jgi:TonB family protein